MEDVQPDFAREARGWTFSASTRPWRQICDVDEEPPTEDLHSPWSQVFDLDEEPPMEDVQPDLVVEARGWTSSASTRPWRQICDVDEEPPTEDLHSPWSQVFDLDEEPPTENLQPDFVVEL